MKKNDIDCKTIQKLVPAFIERDMSPRVQEEFLEHIAHCEDCREELSIQFLVTEGINVLDGSDSYDLKKALDDRLMQAEGEIKRHRKIFWIRNILLIILAAAIVVFVLYLLGTIIL